MNATEAVKCVVETAQKVAKRATQTFPEAAAAGDVARQGDVYVIKLDSIPDGYVKQKQWSLQLAPGTTQGSRHVLDSRVGVTCYTHPQASEFDGPVLCLKKQRELTHPEHGNWILPPGTYGISYQRTMDAEERQRRVAD